ncbi:hypothetical protein EGI22_20125 [Lacihabitans sp. LS3-19]|uniref:hypothetical protein n=1 Tax=Lacihabitans sp. LS3-19 TaxID=2487335 RepID=UPI0020CEF0BF|nr:hypothetical protein [Lacihabitans sp. LS3-19]MCP9770219.1 hypothetical protein [Lacihabitans sp. LS3-19]
MKYFVLFFLFITISASAQYKYAVGARFDRTAGLTFKINKGRGPGAEILLNGFGNGLKATALAEWHEKAFSTGQWRWYYGFGGHMGVASNYHKRYYDDNYIQVGADGILGLEHTFTEIPLNISLDWKPEFNFVNNTGLYLPNFGLSLRYAITK